MTMYARLLWRHDKLVHLKHTSLLCLCQVGVVRFYIIDKIKLSGKGLPSKVLLAKRLLTMGLLAKGL